MTLIRPYKRGYSQISKQQDEFEHIIKEYLKVTDLKLKDVKSVFNVIEYYLFAKEKGENEG